jgi:hypothetical protein
MLKRLEGPIWIAIGVVISFLAQRTGIGSLTEPGAGFVALVSGLFLIVIGLVMSIVRKEKADAHSRPAAPTGVSRRSFKLLYTIALLVFYALIIEPIGYVLTTFLVMFGLFREPERPRFVVPLFASLASVAVTYALFEVWLNARFPRGVFPWW